MATPENVVVVGGCGHVGLPLGIVLASRGLSVPCWTLMRPKSRPSTPAKCPSARTALNRSSSRFWEKLSGPPPTQNCLRSADIVITVVGTPVDRHLNPTVHELYRSLDSVLQYIQDGTLLVLRSTVSPGVTKLVYQRIRAAGPRGRPGLLPGAHRRGQCHGGAGQAAADRFRL